jgi:hypothetical protein
VAFTWRYEKIAGDGSATVLPDSTVEAAVTGSGDHYVTQGDAESWLGENWRALLAGGVDQVSLLEDTNVVYGPMSLRPEQ